MEIIFTTGKFFDLKSNYSTYHNCFFKFGEYYNGGISIQILSSEDGPIMTTTVNIGENFGDRIVAIKDYSENEGILDAMVDAGLIDEVIDEVSLGWVLVPIVRLSEKMLNLM